MKNYRLELILAVLFMALYLAFAHWQAPGSKLSSAEIDGYVQRIEQGTAFMPAEQRAAFIKHLRAWGESDDGQPAYNLNLMRFHKELQQVPGVQLHGSTPEEANAFYEATTLGIAARLGVSMPFGGAAQAVQSGTEPSTNLITYEPALDNWSRVLIVRYPSRRAFFELVSDPEYLKVMPNKLGSLMVVLTPVNGATVLPVPSVMFGGALLFLFMLIGWIRAARRTA
ncbi:hypothetical protein [Pseudomonas sp. N040]|uniref:hypothetical protein n=1 Tax=Pseudomonas sp. N040 TaxID=2785325 RepID=UPI0018A27224|nr:hypothetical protein [Pseudomonas sp. N040]MBF7728522.1 hypothetical protein [Pseudomonas sp. N040]MBW7012162.1 hypothetical protein [Pseudomonas sp. N040]